MGKELLCPVCGRGKLRRTFAGYVCNYLVSITDKCNFQIPLKINGLEITDSIVEDIALYGRSSDLTFTKYSGELYIGYLLVSEDHLRVCFK